VAAIFDPAASFVTFTTPQRGNNARILVEARCELRYHREGRSEEFFLFASCKAEHTYGQGEYLFQQPNYDFSGIFSRTDYYIFRTSASAAANRPTTGPITPQFEGVTFHIAPAAQAVPLTSPRAIVEACLGHHPIMARTELDWPAHGVSATIDYPVKTLNVNDSAWLFQVDTGPVPYPVLPFSGPPIQCFRPAYVVYRTFDSAEFILQEPTFVLEYVKNWPGVADLLTYVEQSPHRDSLHAALSANHYSSLRKHPAQNTLYALGLSSPH